MAKKEGGSRPFGEVASTDHLLETESRERPLLHRIATEHLNLTQLQPQAIEGSLNVDIMH